MENGVGSSVIMKTKVYLEGGLELEYILLSQTLDENTLLPGECFSLEIRSRYEEEYDGIVLEDVAREREEGVELLCIFAKNTVTPESAEYIMEDLLS